MLIAQKTITLSRINFFGYVGQKISENLILHLSLFLSVGLISWL